MPGKFDKHTATVSAICNYPVKLIDKLQEMLTQEQITEIEDLMVPPLSIQETAEEIYKIGTAVKRIGISKFAQFTGLDPAALESAIVTGTAVADSIVTPDPTPVQPPTEEQTQSTP